ncbi:MAG: TRAP transporter substrate-binding protein DctP [Myxococcales bacterium]|nr:TRAP transporter substrate-binding protein DctP [Myxococcales bacterium]MDH3845870.1 TRAP transporter substrate-binding protein DctP [Myxococcales bacterium]
MFRLKTLFVAVLAVGAFSLPGTVPKANAEGATVIRFASLAPAGSAFMKVMKAWNRSLKKQTENRVALRFYSGGSQGDERDFIRKVRAGQMDAAGVTTTGLGIVARPVLVMTSPGLITEYDQLERARTELNDRFAKMFEDGGFQLLAWGEAGKNRLFSVNKFARPADLKTGRPWAWKDDPVFAEFITVIGANPVRLGVPEVYPGLQTRMIDTVPASAIAAVALQWYTRLNYMAKENFGIIVGGSLIKQEKFDELSEVDQKILIDTSERAARALDGLARRDDDRAYDSLVSRGMIEVNTAAYQAEWDAAAAKARKNLTGRVYSKSLLEAVEKIVAGK